MLAVLTSFDGGRLFGEVYGSGPPRVLALHGWRRDHRDFASVLRGSPQPATGEALDPPGRGRSPDDVPLPPAALDAVALDLPGFGSTPAPESAWGGAQYAEAVAGVLSHLAPKVVVVAHSFGGRVAVHLAAAHPEEVAGLLLTGTPLFAAPDARARRPPFRFRALRALARAGVVGEGRLEQARQRYGSDDYRAASGVMRDILVKAIAEERESAYTSSLAAIRCPVEMIWGALDTAAPPSVAEQIVRSLGAPASLTVLPGIGHLTPTLVPGHLRAGIDRLLAAVEAS